VIADHHQPALHKFAFNAARGVGKDHRLNTHARENADGKSHLFRGIALVKMDSALHPRNGNCSYFSDDKLPRVANGGRLREVRNFRVRDFGGISEFVRESAKARAQDEGNLGAQFHLRKNEVSRFARALVLTVL